MRWAQVVPFWPTALSLAAALYAGYGNQWVTVSVDKDSNGREYLVMLLQPCPRHQASA